MRFDPKRTVFAYKTYKPRRGRTEPVVVGNEKLDDNGGRIQWLDEGYSVARVMGSAKSEPSKMGGGAVPSGNLSPCYDCRVIPADDVAMIEAMDAEIERLRQQRERFAQESFQRWPLAKRKDFQNPHQVGESLAQVKLKIAKMAPPSKVAVAAERRSAEAIGKIFGGMR